METQFWTVLVSSHIQRKGYHLLAHVCYHHASLCSLKPFMTSLYFICSCTVCYVKWSVLVSPFSMSFLIKIHQGCHSPKVNPLVIIPMTSLSIYGLDHLICILKIVRDRCEDSDVWSQCSGSYWTALCCPYWLHQRSNMAERENFMLDINKL